MLDRIRCVRSLAGSPSRVSLLDPFAPFSGQPLAPFVTGSSRPFWIVHRVEPVPGLTPQSFDLALGVCFSIEIVWLAAFPIASSLLGTRVVLTRSLLSGFRMSRSHARPWLDEVNAVIVWPKVLGVVSVAL